MVSGFLLDADFFRVKTEPLRVNEAVITNDHVQERDTGFLADNSIRLARDDLAAMLALINHTIVFQQGQCHLFRAVMLSESLPPAVLGTGHAYRFAIAFETDRFHQQHSDRLSENYPQIPCPIHPKI